MNRTQVLLQSTLKLMSGQEGFPVAHKLPSESNDIPWARTAGRARESVFKALEDL